MFKGQNSWFPLYCDDGLTTLFGRNIFLIFFVKQKEGIYFSVQMTILYFKHQYDMHMTDLF